MSCEKEQGNPPSHVRTAMLCKWGMDEVLQSASERKILIPVDGSDVSKDAFGFYLSSLYNKDDIVILVHTLELPPKPAVPFPDVGKFYEEWRAVIQKHRNESRDLLAEYLAMWTDMTGQDLETNIVAIHDEHPTPGQGIVALAKAYNVGLIVIGSRGHGLIRRTILGSVSDFVVHHAEIPVAIVPPCGRCSGAKN